MTSLIPSPNVSLVNGQPATTSFAIAEHFGKQHAHVLRDIRRLMADLPEDVRESNFGLTFRTVAGPKNSQRQEEYFTVFFDGFILLAMGYTGRQALQIKLVYITAFNAMRDELSGNAQKALPEALTPSTADDRKPLRSLVFAWSKAAGVHVDTCWPQVKAYFQLSRLDDLPVEWIPDALTFVQGKIDALPRALPKPVPAPDLDLSHYFKAMRSHSRRLMEEYSDMVVALKVAYPMNWNRQFDHHSTDYAALPLLDMVGNFASVLDGTLRAVQNHAEAFARVKRL